MLRAGVYLYGFSAVATGIANIVWHEFDPAEEPIKATFGGNIPGLDIFALLVAVALIVGGVALFWRRTNWLGATLLAAVYATFAFFTRRA